MWGIVEVAQSWDNGGARSKGFQGGHVIKLLSKGHMRSEGGVGFTGWKEMSGFQLNNFLMHQLTNYFNISLFVLSLDLNGDQKVAMNGRYL